MLLGHVLSTLFQLPTILTRYIIEIGLIYGNWENKTMSSQPPERDRCLFFLLTSHIYMTYSCNGDYFTHDKTCFVSIRISSKQKENRINLN